MIVIVTRNAPPRWRGFLSSSMCEIAPGVYTAPRMTKAVRERVWAVLDSWHDPASEVSAVMTWKAPNTPGGQSVATLGTPRTELVLRDGIYLARRTIAQNEPDDHAAADEFAHQPIIDQRTLPQSLGE